MALTDQDTSNITYKGFRSVTFNLVLLGYVTGTALLVFGFITPEIWETGVLGMLTGYIIRDGVSKIAEVYYQKKIADLKPE